MPSLGGGEISHRPDQKFARVHGHLALVASLRCVLRVLGYPCGFNRVSWRFVQVPKLNFRNGAPFGVCQVACCLQGRSELKYGPV